MRVLRTCWRGVYILSIWIIGFFYGLLRCIFTARSVSNNTIMGRFVSSPTSAYGLKIYMASKTTQLPKKAIYIVNHQNGFDIPILGHILQPRTVIVAKTSLLWIPFFGWLMWLSGNLIINRENASKASNTIKFIVESINSKNHSVIIFPEGTRSKGQYELGGFKMGAFSMAISGQIPIVPVVISDISQHKLSDKQTDVLVKFLEPIDTINMTRRDIKHLMDKSHQLMLEEFKNLNRQLQQRSFSEFTQRLHLDNE